MAQPIPIFVPLVNLLDSTADAPSSDLLRRCLEVAIRLPAQAESSPAIAWVPLSREIERLKMHRPQQAVRKAARALEIALARLEQLPDDPEQAGQFCSLLSTYGGLLRQLGQHQDAALAAGHALSLLSPQPFTTRTGFALQRAAYVLADLGHREAGLFASHQAVAVHQLTPGGSHHKAVALTGLAAFHLFYHRAFDDARAAYTQALEALAGYDDPLIRVSIRHGHAYSFLMEGNPTQARESLARLDEDGAELEPDQTFRIAWLEAEIDAALNEYDAALSRYDDVFEQALSITEASGPVLVSFDIARVLISQDAPGEDWRRWHVRIKPIVETLGRAEQATLEPYLDAIQAGELDRALLDETAVAFRRASNRMLLGMGRPGAAGRPETLGTLSAA